MASASTACGNSLRPPAGPPQTILVIGSDHRAGTPFKDVNTDTILLVRLDPNSKTIKVLSVPCDLRIQIPARGTEKLNTAYFYGGPSLLIKVLRQQVFPGLKVDHVVDFNFAGFEKIVDAIGCVYADIDHRYYNNTAVTNYSSIDIEPGYQKLCGADALSFVRFRHTDSDIVRNARQQDFIRWAKAQFSQSRILSEEGTLLRIFGDSLGSLLHAEGPQSCASSPALGPPRTPPTSSSSPRPPSRTPPHPPPPPPRQARA